MTVVLAGGAFANASRQTSMAGANSAACVCIAQRFTTDPRSPPAAWQLPALVRAVPGLQERQHELRFHLIRTVHDDGRSRYRRRLRAEPVVFVVRTKRPQHHGSGWPGQETVRSLRRCAGGEVKPRHHGD